jgi:transcriptional regulator GlxA family with amidase domain
LEVSRDFLPALGFLDPTISGPVRNHYLARIGLELREELLASDELSPFMLEGIALRTLVSVLRLVKRKSKEQQEVEAVQELLDRGARVESVTRRYLTTVDTKALRRVFQETEGCSMYTYALRRRGLRAYEELLNTDHSLAEIAVRAGFYDQAHFTKVFSRLFGVTPGRFRSKQGRM